MPPLSPKSPTLNAIQDVRNVLVKPNKVASSKLMF